MEKNSKKEKYTIVMIAGDDVNDNEDKNGIFKIYVNKNSKSIWKTYFKTRELN